MSEFVNYNKRSITLPPGCKDLIDVLRPLRAHKVPLTEFGPHRAGEDTGKLSEVRRYAEMLFAPRARLFMLAICSPDSQVTIQAMRSGDDRFVAGLYVQEQSPEETALRNLLVGRGLALPEDKEENGPLIPQAPVYRRYEIIPLPLGAAHFADLVVEILRTVFGLNDASQIRFNYDEVLEKSPEA